MAKRSLQITFLFIILLSSVTLFSGCGLSESQKEAKNLYTAAGERFHMKDYNGAIDDLNKAIELDPTYAQAFNMRGQIYLGFATMLGDDPAFFDKEWLNLGCSDLREASSFTDGNLESVEKLLMKYCYEWIMSHRK